MTGHMQRGRLWLLAAIAGILAAASVGAAVPADPKGGAEVKAAIEEEIASGRVSDPVCCVLIFKYVASDGFEYFVGIDELGSVLVLDDDLMNAKGIHSLISPLAATNERCSTSPTYWGRLIGANQGKWCKSRDASGSVLREAYVVFGSYRVYVESEVATCSAFQDQMTSELNPTQRRNLGCP